jgi:restriction endonuclease S subunit
MMKWETKRLGEVLRHRKGSITIDDTTTYKLCRVQLHRRGVVLRQHLSGAQINTKKQQVCKAGDFLVAEMDAKVGGYGFVPPELDGAIVSSHYYLFELDASKLHPPFLEVISQAQILQQQIVAKGSTNYSSIRPDSVLAWQIPLPEMDVQKRVARNFETIQSQLASVVREITHQETLVAKLKQAILQEAIAGKLTADWRAAHPDVEPASQLLHRIQSGKARLIAAKKLRPEKPLPKITPAEMPFEIPQGWEWCRFGPLTKAYEAGSSFKCEDREVVGDEWGVIKTSAVTSGVFVERENKFLRTEAPADTTAQVAIGDLIFCRASGSKGLAGKCAIVRECSRNLLLSDKTIRVPLMAGVNQSYIALHNDSAIARAYFDGLGMGKSTSMNNVTRDDLFMKPVPLPPLAEQSAIVARVDALMEHCRALATEIEHTRTHAAHLLQAVLKEAFAPASTHG